MAREKRKTKGTPDSVDVHVGNRLRVRRSLLGLSQERLADSVGLTFQQVQKYEKGMNRISAGRLFEFSKILDVPISYFYEEIVDKVRPKPKLHLADNDQEDFMSADLMNSKETLDLIRLYYSIPDQNMRKDIFRFIKSIADRAGTSE